MEEKFIFEQLLYGDEEDISLIDIEFVVDRIVELPKIRPHKLEKAVSLAIKFCQIADFRRVLLGKLIYCPIIIYKLFKLGVFVFEEIKPYMKNVYANLLNYYFMKEINDIGSFVQKSSDIELLIEFGFLPSSIEYHLKYDVIDELVNYNVLNQEAQWSPFEWSYKPEYLDLLSFSGFFGSIKCFKYLLMNGFQIHDEVTSMVVCGGCFDLYHLCRGSSLFTIDNVSKAAEFFQLPLLEFMFENGVEIKTNHIRNEL